MIANATRDLDATTVNTATINSGTGVDILTPLTEAEMLPASVLELIAKVRTMGGNSSVLICHAGRIDHDDY